MRGYLSPIALTAVFLLAACAARPPLPDDTPALRLLPPADLATESLLTQTLTLRTNGREQQFLAVVRLERERVRMAVLTPAGQQLLSLDYDGENLLQNSVEGVAIPGRQILASLQFALWPEDSIRREYRPDDGWRVEIGDAERSLLTAAGALLIIHREFGSLTLDNLRYNYRVIVETLERTDL